MSVHSPRPLASSRTRSKKNLPRCSFPSNVPPLTPDHRVMSHHSINRTSHSISIHNAVSATPKTVPGATRAFASSGTPADCTMLGISVLYRAKRFDYIVSGVNRGDNLGLHVVYSGTVAGAREGAMRTGAVGVAVSLDSYSRSADYSEAVSLFLLIFVRAIRLTTACVFCLFPGSVHRRVGLRRSRHAGAHRDLTRRRPQRQRPELTQGCNQRRQADQARGQLHAGGVGASSWGRNAKRKR